MQNEMFKKLLSNLPFNPSLIDQVGFYARRLRREAAIRRTGFAIMALAVVVQVFAVVSPPQATLAHSSNDLLQGGVETADSAEQNCKGNVGGFADVLDHYNISCDSLKTTKTVKLKSSDDNGKIYTIGRLAYGQKGETPVDVKGRTYWSRPLSSLDQAGEQEHQALEGVSRDGQKYYIVKSCGGLTFVGTPPAPSVRCQWNTDVLASDPKCYQPCPIAQKQYLPQTDPSCAQPCPVAGKSKLLAKDPACYEACPVKGKETVAKNSADCFEPCSYNSAVAATNPACKPCEGSVDSQDTTACLILSKTVKNDSGGISDANNTTAHAGDSLTYTLSAQNKGKAKVASFIIQENISDVLDYADVVNLGGSSKDENEIIAWPATVVNVGETVTKQFTIKIKSPVPSTPTSASDPSHFDLKLTNVYGNAGTIKVPSSVVKSAEVVTHTLPNTGPGSSLAISFVFMTVIGYFFARSKLLSRELQLVRNEQTAGGGMSL